MVEDRVHRRLAAILAADVAGYSRLMGNDEEGTLAALKTSQREVIDPKVSEHRGRIVNSPGDSVLIEFASAVDATQCAVEIQKEMAKRNSVIPGDRRVEFRIGINVGDVIVDNNDNIYGDGVNIAARVESLARPGALCLSEDAYKQIKGKLAIHVSDMGEHQLKNIALPVRIYHVQLDGNVAKLDGNVAKTAPALPDKPSIAVLPFSNMSGDPEQEYFADGMTEEIITALSKVHWFFVISRNSSFTYKGKAVELKQAGRELGVRFFLEGSIRRAGSRMRVTAQLIDAISGHHLWAERYDRNIVDIFVVQDEITEQVVSAIAPRLYAVEGLRAKRKPPDSLDAWECVVRALSLMNNRTESEVSAAQELLQKAIVLDPSYALAYALLSFVTTLGVHMGWDRENVLASAWDNAHKALQLDADDPWAHLALGYVLVWRKQVPDALVEYEKALAINPNFAIAYYLIALANVFLGRSDEALVHADTAARLSPRDLLARGHAGVYNAVRATAYFVSGQYRDSIEYARKAIAESPNLVPAHRMLVISSALAGEVEEAKLALEVLKHLTPEISLKRAEQMTPIVRDQDRRRYLEGLRLAGLK
jgi:adenylate cyclase